MIFGVVLAGGVGSRMGNEELPKQFMLVGDKPILIHTLEKFCGNSVFQEVLVLCPDQWVTYTKNLIKKHFRKMEQTVVLSGGSTRNETIMKAVSYIEDTYGLDEKTMVVTHDSVRPFVTLRIIEENIRCAKEFGVCDTVVAATDTIVCSEDGIRIGAIPERRKIYQSQTPQTFPALKLKNLYYSLTEAEKASLTDAAGIFVLKGENVYLVKGEVSNIKITYPYDLYVAEAILKERRQFEL